MTLFRPASLLVSLVAPVALAAFAGAAEQPPRRGGFPARGGQGAAAGEPRVALSFHGSIRYLTEITSDLFEANEADFGVTPAGEADGGFGLEIGYTPHARLDLFFGAEWSESAYDSSYLEYTFEDGSEIVHTTFTELTDLDLGVRFRFLGPDAAARPYVSAGVSGNFYRYAEDGDFVDTETSDIFYDRFEERHLRPGFFLGAGFDYAMTRGPRSRLDLFVEGRYSAYGGRHRDGFDGFGPIESHWVAARLGFRFRF